MPLECQCSVYTVVPGSGRYDEQCKKVNQARGLLVIVIFLAVRCEHGFLPNPLNHVAMNTSFSRTTSPRRQQSGRRSAFILRSSSKELMRKGKTSHKSIAPSRSHEACTVDFSDPGRNSFRQTHRGCAVRFVRPPMPASAC